MYEALKMVRREIYERTGNEILESNEKTWLLELLW